MRILKMTQRGQQEFDITAYTETGLQDTASMIHVSTMALFVCLLSVCPRAYRRDYTSDFRQILCMLPSVAQCSPGGNCHMLCNSGFVDGDTFAQQ